MLSLLFVLGLLVGIGVAVIAVVSAVVAVGKVLVWLNGLVVILRARIDAAP
jgi:hypothetical protein